MTLTAVAEYSINFNESKNMFCLSLHENGSNSFVYVNIVNQNAVMLSISSKQNTLK